jgi:serine/threonine protein kinase
MTDQDDKKTHGKQVKSLFNQCLEDPENITAIITNSPYSEQVKHHVKDLLDSIPDHNDLTQKVVDSVQVSVDAQPLVAKMKIGHYELLQPLGKGGQAEVWLAERKDGDFQHQVAIKFLKPLFDEADLLRFQSERSLLAKLRHPNIAQLLDGGEIGSKRPYMVIELVEGISVVDYGTQENFTIDQYLNCFLQICDAVSYAHANSVIHRDIKPSNVLITSGGDVKLLDFGIAKFIKTDDINTLTMPVLTLAYSSPEQLTGGAVSTATDVYAMGLLLYELLTGHQAQGDQDSLPADLIREITDQAPELPSQALQKNQHKRNYTAKHLQGDLDNLVMMAIRKEPDRRYPTVDAMAQDVRNFLADKPITATGDAWWYTSKKLIQRNPTSSFLACALVALFIFAQVMLLNQQQETKQQRDEAIQAKEQAVRSNEFLVNILESASPIAAQGEDVKLSDVLITAERQLLYGLNEQTELKADLLGTLARIHHSLGADKKSLAYYQQALVLYKAKNDTNQTLKTLGELSITYYLNEDIEAAKNAMTEAKILATQVTDVETLGWHQAFMATMANFLGDHDYTRSELPAIIQQLSTTNAQHDRLLGRLYNELSLAYNFNDFSPEQATEYSRKALQNAADLFGTHHPIYVSRLMNLATILNGQSISDEAEDLLLQAEKIGAKIYTEHHPFYAQIIGELATTYHDQGRFSETETLYQKARIISAELSGENSISHVIQLNNLAYLYEDMGDYANAEPLYRLSLKKRQAYFSEVPRRLSSSAINLARLLVKMELYDEASQWLAYAANQDKNPGLKFHLVDLALQLGRQSKTGGCDLHQTNFQQVLSEVEQIAPDHWRRMQAELWLGQITYACHETKLATKLLNAAKEKSTQIYAKSSDGQKLIHALVDELLSKMAS